MAAKKAQKKAAIIKENESDFGMLEIYLLIIIGFIGLINSFNVFTSLPFPNYFTFIGSMLVFVIGVTKLIGRTG
ncbi:TPA: hypothetical protein HA225_04330 [Candidatus Micrarchaeota archaeon]|nr:hypothetical protein [Candidatus Micrarchaeota archaeon]HIH30077.1 hypothetical protein [Candidatus Micrarchaeota archaeon]